jgi:intraflagellar transport protein 122
VKSPDAVNAVLDHELIVGCWDKSLSCYKVQSGSCTIVADKRLKFYPCALSISGVKTNQSKLTSVLVNGSNGKASIYSKDCIFLADVQERKGWTFANACHGDTDRVAVGNEAGFIDILQLSFNVVHALYKDRYVYRENLTEVVIQHLLIDRKIRIKCKELVEKVSLYKNHLVVKLTNKVTIYESSPDDPTDLHFRSRKEKIPYSITCDLMATVSQGVFFCNKSLVEYFTFDGTRQRVWQLGCNVSYVRIDGGAAGCEAIIIGLGNGNLIKLYAANPFPVQLFKIDNPIVACDLDCRRNTIALIDTNSKLTITDLKSQKVLFSVENATSVSFNTDMDGSLAYSNDERIFIISGVNCTPIDPDKHVEVLPYHAGGSVLGYYGNRIFCLVKGGIYGTDVSQSVSLQRAIESNDLKSAYKIACLGATERDLRLLAVKSLRIGDLSVAKKCYSKLKDIKFLNLVESIERSSNTKQPSNFGFLASDTGAVGKERRNRGSASTQQAIAGVGASKSLPTAALESSWQAEVLAYEGHFNEAAKMYVRAENIDEAIRLLVDLRRWDDARMFAQNAGRSGDQLDLTLGQANWLQEIGDWKASSELFSSMGRYMQAAKVIVESAESGWQTNVIELVRSIPSDQKEVLSYCGEELCSANEDLLAKETLQKLGDLSRLMQLYVKKCMWSDAAKLADEFEGDFDRSIFLPYAEWLISQDQFEEAMAAYRKAARQDLAKKVLEELTFNAVIQRQYKDASYYYFLLSKESADGSNTDTDRQSYELKADLYYAYSYIHSCIADSFTNQQPEALFQISRFVLNGLGNSADTPLGISKFSSFYTLAKQAMKLGCYKLARHCFDRLGRLLSPVGVRQEEIEKVCTLIVLL